MSQLTEERFEQILNQKLANFATKDDLRGLATKADLQATEQRLIKRIDEAQEELANMVNDGFNDVIERLDVRDRVSKLESDFSRLKDALHLSV